MNNKLNLLFGELYTEVCSHITEDGGLPSVDLTKLLDITKEIKANLRPISFADNTWDSNSEIAIIWSIEDIQESNNNLTNEQAFDVLTTLDRYHDYSYGISWDTVADTITNMYPDVEHDEDKEDDDK
tara:strand:+ start:1568 stop:1948 length:381 start_codon:yes stop_codon:yes gene_type:complete